MSICFSFSCQYMFQGPIDVKFIIQGITLVLLIAAARRSSEDGLPPLHSSRTPGFAKHLFLFYPQRLPMVQLACFRTMLHLITAWRPSIAIGALWVSDRTNPWLIAIRAVFFRKHTTTLFVCFMFLRGSSLIIFIISVKFDT